ncbi:MAG: xanthine dehydrogenase family protein molybdopterin-binding subunit [Chloroflexi bacterium]|nr:xanthine dehydrogenase family protein molybdopterin-binding subunit [Chloroflexota bacterium]
MTTIEAPGTKPATAPEAPAAPQRLVIGQRVPKFEGIEKVTGKAQYGADVSRSGMLWGKLLLSPHAHARIKHIDTTKARAMPGVFAVLTGEDLPRLVGEISNTPPAPEEFDVPSRAKQALAWEKVVFFGQPVAAVAALTPSLAEEAVAAIEVEYEPLKPVVDVLEAMKPDAPLVWETVFTETFAGKSQTPSNVAKLTELSRGDVEKGFAEADVVAEASFRTEMVHQGYIEPQATLAEYGPDGRFTVWTSTQGQFGVRGGVSGFLKIPARRVRVFGMEIGGGFGAKGAQTLEPICVLLAYAAGRPVKMQLSRSEVLRSTHPAPGTAMHVTIGARRDGTITAAKARYIWDVGAYPGGNSVGGINIGFGPWKVPNFHFEAYDVLTNRPSTRAYRAPNGPQGAFAVESVLNMLAEKLGMDPLELRLKNAVVEGDRNPSEVPYPKIGFVQTLEALRRHPAWTEPVPPASRPGWVRGRGIACGTWGGGVGTSTAHVNISEDGSASVVTGAVDLAGTRTTMAQIAAEELQIPYERITVVQPDTDSAPFNNPTGGSRITFSLGTAVHRAAVDARTKLKQRTAQQLKVPPDNVEYAQGKFWVRGNAEQSLTIQQVARASIGSGEGPVIGTGQVTHLLRAPAFAAQVVEVEVDRETGLTQVVKVTAAQDVGCAINPTACEGQIQGGVVQGIGWALTEAYVYDEEGRLRNPSLLDYRMPTALDAPNIECVLVEVPAADGPYGVRGTGEVPIVPAAPAIAAAVYDAIGARVTELPMTGDKVLAAIAAGGDSNGKARRLNVAAVTTGARSAVASARQSALKAQRAPAAGSSAAAVALPTEREDYCAEDDV